MKFEWNKRYTTIAVYIALVILFSVLTVFLFLRLDVIHAGIAKLLSVAKPLLYAVGIAYLLWPILLFFERTVFGKIKKLNGRKKPIRILSLISTYIIFLCLLSLFFSTVIPQITDSVMTLQDKMSGYLRALQEWINQIEVYIPSFISDNFEELRERISDIITNLASWLSENGTMLISKFTSYAAGFATEMKNALLGIIFAVYFLLFKENLLAQLKKFFSAILPARFYQKCLHYVTITDHTFGGFINGKLLDSLIIGCLCFFFMKILGMPYAPLISLIVGVTNIIPFFGPFIGAIPSAFIILIADPDKFLWFVLLIFLLQQLDGNVIGPKILGDFIGLNPLWIIVAITVMGGLFGVFGMFFGVPLFAVFYTILKELIEKNLARKGLPQDTAAYYTSPDYLDIVQREKPERKSDSRFHKVLQRVKDAFHRHPHN